MANTTATTHNKWMAKPAAPKSKANSKTKSTTPIDASFGVKNTFEIAVPKSLTNNRQPVRLVLGMTTARVSTMGQARTKWLSPP